MDSRNIWPLVVIVGMALAAVTVLALSGVDTTDVIAVLTLLALPIVSVPLYSRLEALRRDTEILKTQTNGQLDKVTTSRDEVIRRVLDEYLRTHATDRQIVQQTAQQAITPKE